jgi:ribosomal protein L2
MRCTSSASSLRQVRDAAPHSDVQNKHAEKFMLMLSNKDAGQNNDTRITNKFSEHVAKFQYLGITVTDQNYILKEVNTCYH